MFRYMKKFYILTKTPKISNFYAPYFFREILYYKIFGICFNFGGGEKVVITKIFYEKKILEKVKISNIFHFF
jgi:hypothetical protein